MNPVPKLLSAVSPMLLLALAPAPARAETTALYRAGTTLLVGSGATFHLRRGGSETRLDLPPGARVEELFELAGATLLAGFAPAAVPRGDGDELFLALVDEAGAHPLPPPPGRGSGVDRENGVALAGHDGTLDAVAWLEGESRRSYAVKLARWNGSRFDEPIEIAAAGPGSQLALAAATLDDGTGLLVWSRFDGTDDEIFFAQRRDGRWSPAAALAPGNSVPDVAPAVVAVSGGALATWSRFDGREYRVVVARHADGAWSPPDEIGERGSSFPTLIRNGDGALLLHASATPRGWTVIELRGDGGALRRAAVRSERSARPVVVGDRLVWADREERFSFRPASDAGE